MQDNYYLHDAKVLSPAVPLFYPSLSRLASAKEMREWFVGFQQRSAESGLAQSVFLVLQLDAPPRECLVLHYRFATIESLSHYLDMEENLPFLEWQNDEISLSVTGDLVEFRHSVLFANGVEISLRFRDFDYATLRPLAPPSQAMA